MEIIFKRLKALEFLNALMLTSLSIRRLIFLSMFLVKWFSRQLTIFKNCISIQFIHRARIQRISKSISGVAVRCSLIKNILQDRCNSLLVIIIVFSDVIIMAPKNKLLFVLVIMSSMAIIATKGLKCEGDINTAELSYCEY